MKGKQILLIEDNADHEALTLRALARSDIANVAVARDGEEALSMLFGTGRYAGAPVEPDLVLLDLQLPKVDGLEVLRKLRAEASTRLLPVVVLTSSDEERDIVQSYRLGANSYIRKPVDFDKFIEATRQLGVYWLRLNENPPHREPK